jgi:prepilin-type N-terminal cleavage/methylation domain-containing protein
MTTRDTDARARGFTLIELLVVMAILTGFLLMLVQLVDGGLRMFTEGELGQALTDRASHAQRVLAHELSTLRGSASGRDRESVDDRLVVQNLPFGVPARPEHGAPRMQVLRGAVHIDADREIWLIDQQIVSDLAKDNPELTPAEVEQRMAQLRQGKLLHGFGNLLLIPFPQEGDDEDVLVELRAGWFLPGQTIPVGADKQVDPFAVPVPGSPDLPALALYTHSAPLLQNLLHVEFLLWGQNTQNWGDAAGTGTGGALRMWDSARGGWLVDDASGGAFPLDRGPASLADPRDDVHPHAILVRVVVDQPAEFAPAGLLAEGLTADATTAYLQNGEHFPGPLDGGWFKLRGEWIAYAELAGDELRGLRRGQRATKPLDHPAGTRVHVGKTVEFVVPIPHAKDDWNG